MKEPFTPYQKTSPTNSGKERRFRFILLNAADVISAAGLLVGAGFFTLILLTGMNIALQRSTMEGFWMVMGLAISMSILISLLAHHTIAKVHHFKEKVLEQVLPSIPSADHLSDLLSLLTQMQTEMQKQKEILLSLQKELSKKEKNIHTDDHSLSN